MNQQQAMTQYGYGNTGQIQSLGSDHYGVVTRPGMQPYFPVQTPVRFNASKEGVSFSYSGPEGATTDVALKLAYNLLKK
jgi:hypothetical protein